MVKPKLGRLLIVDDEIELMTVLCETLDSHGYETEGFNSPHEALKKLKKEEYDLLLTDLMMPEMDGIAFLKKALDIDPGVIGIIMTGQGTVQTAVEAMKTGAFDYILKPFKVNVLLPIISRALGVRKLKKENIELRATLAIYELTKAVTITTDLNVVVDKVADAAMEQTQADEVSVMLPVQGDDDLYVAAVRGKERDHLLGQRIKAGQGIAGWVANHHQLIQLEGPVTDQRFNPVNPRSDIQTSVSIPMMAGGKFVGVLNLNAVSRRSFTIGEIKALDITIGIAAPSIENARLFDMLQTAEAKYRNIFENTLEGIFQLTPDGRFVMANPSLAGILGYDSPEDVETSLTDIACQLFVDPAQLGLMIEKLNKEGKIVNFESEVLRKDGKIIWISNNVRAIQNSSDGSIRYYEGSAEDITHRKKAEARQGLFIRILDLLNQVDEKEDLIQKVLYLLKEHTRIKAIGLRLREGEDFPYYATNGFPEEFLQREKYLCARGENGKIIRNSQGQPYLECMCGNVLCKRTDPSLPFFTEGGSFWTNSTSHLPAATFEKDFPSPLRERFKNEGYESIALIPLRSGEEIIGLLQMNDRRPNRFSPDEIHFIEGIGASIGIALARKHSEETLKKTLEKLQKTLKGTVQAISSTVETRDPYTAGHQRRVSNLAWEIAREMGLSKEVIENVQMAGILHDIGKISIPSDILSKPSKLSDIEFGLIKTHPQSGYDILKEAELPGPIAEIVLQHHERINGSGYPRGLSNGQILFEAKVLAIADVVEAMASHRPYRPGWGIDKALEEISQNKDRFYDPQGVDACVRLFQEKGFRFQ